jgi:hypothetical protein
VFNLAAWPAVQRSAILRPQQLRYPSRSRHLLRVVAFIGDGQDQGHSASQLAHWHDRWLHCPLPLLFQSR